MSINNEFIFTGRFVKEPEITQIPNDDPSQPSREVAYVTLVNDWKRSKKDAEGKEISPSIPNFIRFVCWSEYYLKQLRSGEVKGKKATIVAKIKQSSYKDKNEVWHNKTDFFIESIEMHYD